MFPKKKRRKGLKFRKKKKPLYKRKGFWIGLTVILFIGFLVWTLFFSSWFQIRYLEITGTETIDKNELLNFCREKIPRNFVFLSSQSIFLVSTKELRESIQEKYPQVEEVFIKRRFPKTLTIQIKERRAVANFLGCQKTFLVDKEGVIFREENNSQLFLVQKEGTKDCFLGKKILNQKEMEALFLIKDKFYPGEEISVIKFYPFKAEVLAGRGWKVIFSLEKDLAKQLDNLAVLIDHKIKKENLSRVEYIDLRFDEIFYKLKEKTTD
ncbi:FtsQ-type POTRA domain-containing protein [bacterium]|nr:FtsQ-type POTRA domain-containing protein [bacterium]